MPDNTLTLELEGDVSLSEFADSITHFNRLILELTREVAGDSQIEWLIDDLQAGSALATVVGIYPDDEPVLEVIRAYDTVGKSLQRYEPIPFSQGVIREATAITQKINGKITSIRLSTVLDDHVLYGAFDTQVPIVEKPRASLGTVKGRVQAISSRGRLKFVLYDAIFDKSITCYLQDNQENTLRDIWGELVWVTGNIVRDPLTGRPKTVRNINAIDKVNIVEPGSYKEALGVLSWIQNVSSDTLVRQLRDVEA
jgi:hypothetical protein